MIVNPAYDEKKILFHLKVFSWNMLSVVGKVKIIITPTYDDNRAKIALWNDPQEYSISYVYQEVYYLLKQRVCSKNIKMLQILNCERTKVSSLC